MSATNDKTIIGRTAFIEFAGNSAHQVPAKIDSGADTSSVWASHIHETDKGLQFQLFDTGSEFYTAEVITLPKGSYRVAQIASSFGHKQARYVVSLEVTVLDRKLRAEFSLANRSTKNYPILLGCSLLANDFLVDVTEAGPALIKSEILNEDEA